MSTRPHDALFRATFSQPEHAAVVLRDLLPPEIVAHLDFDTLDPQPDSFIDEALRARYSDLLYKVQFAGRPAFVYVLFEHMSTSEPLMPFRVLRYKTDIWSRYITASDEQVTALPPIASLVVHHSDSGWRGATRMLDIYDLPDELRESFAPYLPDFRFVLDDLSHQSDDDLRARALSALVTLVLWALARARGSADIQADLAGVVDLVRRVVDSERGVEALVLILRYILEVTNAPSDTLATYLHRTVDSRTAEAVMTTAERLRQEGREEGLQQGLQQGLQRGRAEGRAEGREEGLQKGQVRALRGVLVRMLARRFGAVTDRARARIESATVDQLQQWTDRVLDAERVDDVFGAVDAE